MTKRRHRHKPARQGVTRTLVIPDCHCPYEDALAFDTMLAAARVYRPDIAVIIGDFADCYAVSAHPKPPERRSNLAWEIAEVNKRLDQIGRLGARRVIYCAGNHEYRFDRFIRDKAPELFGVAPNIQTLFRVRERGWEWVPYMRTIKVGKVAYTHELGRCGVNTARQTLLDYGGNIVVGHSHRAGVSYQGTIDDGGRVCMNVGWLGSVAEIDYAHHARAERDWEHGFGTVEQDRGGVAWMTFIPIIQGRCIIDGRVVSGRKRAA